MTIVDEWMDKLRADQKSEETVKTYGYTVINLMRHAGKELIEIDKYDVYNYVYREGVVAITSVHDWEAISYFYRWAVKNNKIIDDSALVGVKKPKAGKRLPSRIMSEKETSRVLQVKEPNQSEYEFRDQLIMELMYSCLLRRGDVYRLDVSCYDRELKSLRVKAGKNRKAKLGYMSPDLALMVERYIDEIRCKVSDSEALFLNRYGERLSTSTISKNVSDTRKESKIRTKATSHSFRKSSATHMLKRGCPIIHVAALLGNTLSNVVPYTEVCPTELFKKIKAQHPRNRQKNEVLPELKVPTRIIWSHDARGKDYKNRGNDGRWIS